MTIASTTVQTSGSAGNGATTQFSFSFHIDDYGAVEAEDQIQVILETIATGAETILTRTTHYTVSINADQSASPGGSITTVATYSSAYKIWIRLNPSFLQATDYQNQGGFLMETVEDQADQHQRQILALKDMVRRAPRVGIQAGTSFDGEITGDLTAGAWPTLKSDLTGYQWTTNSGSATAVTATGSTTGRTLADRFAETLAPQDEGAGGAGTTNDTVDVQTVLNLNGEGDATRFVPGSNYSVTNLTLPTNTAALSSGIRNGMYVDGGMASITARSGGDTDYMVATDRWLGSSADKSSAGSPWAVHNVVFDAAGLTAKAVAVKSFWTHWTGCYFQGATETDFEYTRQNEDASNGTSSYLSDSVWFCNRFQGDDCTQQFRSRGTNASDLDAPTDGSLLFNVFNGKSAADYGIVLGSGAGWMAIGNRLYSHTTAGAYIKRFGRGLMFALNNMDSDGTAPAMVVGEVGSYPDGMIGPGNVWYADLRVDFKDDTSAERVIVQGDRFSTQPAGSPDAVAIHNNNRSQKELVIKDSAFEASPIYERAVGNTLGVIKAYNVFSASESGEDYIAALLDAPTATGHVLRYARRNSSRAANDVLNRFQHEGDDSAGNLTSYASEESYIVDATDGSEDGGYRVKVQKGGSETTAIDATGNGLAVLGCPTWRILAASAATGMSHTGDTNATTLATISVPANALGPNGRVRIRTLWTITNNGNNKTLRANFGGTTFQTHVSANQASYRMEVEISNRNDAAVQISNSVQAQGGWGNTTNANSTGTIDTTSAQNVTISGQLANSADTVTLDSYIVEVFYKA